MKTLDESSPRVKKYVEFDIKEVILIMNQLTKNMKPSMGSQDFEELDGATETLSNYRDYDYRAKVMLEEEV